MGCRQRLSALDQYSLGRPMEIGDQMHSFKGFKELAELRVSVEPHCR